MGLLEIYQSYSVTILYLLLLSILISLFFIKFRKIMKLFDKIDKKTWFFLVLIFLTGFILRVFVFPQVHLMYIDEPLYLEMAKNINLNGQFTVCDYLGSELKQCNFWSLKAPAWPFLISIAFSIFGLNNYVALYFSSILGSLSIILIFLFCYLIFNNQKMGLWSAFLLSLTPLHIMWSNSAETNNPSLFFILLTFCFFLIYIKTKDKSLFIFATLMLAFTILVRFENIILIILLALAYIKLSNFPKKSIFKTLDPFYPSIIVLVLISTIPIAFFSINYFRDFLFLEFPSFYFLNFLPLIKSASLNYLYLVLPLLILVLKQKKDIRALGFVVSTFIVLFFFYMPLFVENRMALNPSVFLIILSAYSLEKLGIVFGEHRLKIRLFLIFFLSLFFILGLNISYENIDKRFTKNILETQSVVDIKRELPGSCYIIAEYPLILTSSSDLKGISTKNAIMHQDIVHNLLDSGECIYYFYDGYCHYDKISRQIGSEGRCQEFLSIFDRVEEKQFKRGNINFYLYRLK